MSVRHVRSRSSSASRSRSASCSTWMKGQRPSTFVRRPTPISLAQVRVVFQTRDKPIEVSGRADVDASYITSKRGARASEASSAPEVAMTFDAAVVQSWSWE